MLVRRHRSGSPGPFKGFGQSHRQAAGTAFAPTVKIHDENSVDTNGPSSKLHFGFNDVRIAHITLPVSVGGQLDLAA